VKKTLKIDMVLTEKYHLYHVQTLLSPQKPYQKFGKNVEFMLSFLVIFVEFIRSFC